MLRELIKDIQKSRRFFNLADHHKQALSPKAHSLEHGYRGIGAEKIRGKAGVKENFDFGDPRDNSLGSWPEQGQLPGFREFAEEFHQVCTLSAVVKRYLTKIRIAINLYMNY